MALTQTQVSQLYVVLFGRASEGSGNKNVMNAYSNMIEAANEMLKHEAVAEYFGGELTDEQFVTFIYENTFGFTPSADDLANNLALLIEDGMSRGELVANLIETAMSEEYAGSDAQNLFINKVAVSNYVADNLENLDASRVNELAFKSSQKDGALNVTSDEASVEAAKDAIDEIANEDQVDPTLPSKTEYLSVSQDKFTDGGAVKYTFEADVAQNQNGEQVNTLGSGDVLVGGTGKEDTLDATLIAAYNVAGKAMDVTPTTNSVEIVNINAQLSDKNQNGTINNEVVLNAQKMNGVREFTSNESDADLIIKNIMGNDKGNYTVHKDMTIGMKYTGNKDSQWKEVDMKAFFNQDYLTRKEVQTNSLYYFTQDRKAANENGKPFGAETDVDGLEFTLNGQEINVSIDSDIFKNFLANVPADRTEAYKKFVELLNDALATKNAEMDGALDGFTIELNTNFVRTHGAHNNAGDKLKFSAPAIVLTAPANVQISDPSMHQREGKFPTSDTYNDVDVAKPITENTPVSVNVDLEKVGNAADGGALVIGSMNKDTAHDNEYGFDKDGKSNAWGQGITTTDTVAGFDEFNVHVAGDKTKNSSLSALHSTNNSLRKVTIDSKTGSDANLTIGNSNTLTAGNFDTSANNAEAFKDVQIMDASKFKGDLVLNAGFTDEIVAKYLANAEETTLYGLNNPAKELALFEYKGGAGNDTLNLQFASNFATNFVDPTGVDKNLFKMNIDGGAGNDTITIGYDDAAAAGLISNMTINGGAGNDTIDISDQTTSVSHNIAFNGSFGHDTIVGFVAGSAVTLTDEAQTLDLVGFTAHAGEVIKVTVGNVTTQYTVGTGVTLDDAGIAAQVALMLAGTTSGYATTQQFTSATAGTTVGTNDHILTLAKTDANVNSVTVEVINQVEDTGTYDKVITPTISATSTTQKQGGLLEGANGADTLDFSAYNVAKIFVGTAQKTDALDVAETNGKGSIHLIESAHDSNVYNVYYNATGDAQGSNVIGSIELFEEDGETGVALTALNDTQFLI